MSTIPATTSASFESDVIARSHRSPVVVDFWAQWCGPCHQLSPLLERVAARYEAQVTLVKVDVDANPDLAARYRVQGIPAVKAFADGEVVSEFTGVQAEAQIERFFAGLVPSEADRLVESAKAAEDPEPLLRQALAAEPAHPEAAVALAELLADRGESEEALALVERVPGHPGAQRVRATLRLADDVVDDGELAALRERVDDGDAQARLVLGRALAARGEHEEALDVLLVAVADPETKEPARAAVIDIFDVLGPGDPLVTTRRPRLASALYA